MDISKLIPFIKEALLTVSPEEVAAQLQKQQQSKQEDKQRETVDNDVIEQDENPNDDQQNTEGDMMSSSFKELEVEEAIEQAKEEKMLQGTSDSGPAPGGNIKTANMWQLLSARIKR
jgi:Ca2+-dependent lipid-binding protein